MKQISPPSITSRGQTTIPKDVRKTLHLKSNDKIVYIPDGKKIFITSIKGSILELKASLKPGIEKPGRSSVFREKTKAAMVKDAMKEMK